MRFRCPGPLFLLSACSALLLPVAATVANAAGTAKQVGPDHVAKMREALDLFRQKVRPALTKNCLECHSGAKPKGELDLTTRESLAGSGMLGDTADESSLYANIAHIEKPFMPYKRPKLPDETIAAFKRWIDLGAPYDGPLSTKAA